MGLTKLFGTANHGLGTVFGAATDKQTSVARLRKFDDVAVEASLQRLHFLKVDVEGAEWMVLKGAEECIRRFRPVIVAESSAGNFEKAGCAPKDLYQYLKLLLRGNSLERKNRGVGVRAFLFVEPRPALATAKSGQKSESSGRTQVRPHA
jgi:Methyltransferase FkbM domain